MRKASSSSQTASKEVSLTLIGAIMSFEENTQQTQVKTTSHYWGYRELEAHELAFVGGGGDFSGDGFGDGGSGSGAGSNTTEAGALGSGTYGDDYSGFSSTGTMTSGGPTGARGCTPADTPASCAAREAGYQSCTAIANTMQGVANVFGGLASQTIAQQLDDCKSWVDKTVDWAFRTEMEEQQMNQNQNQNYSPGYDGSN
jgi:hypothetical protein